MAFFRYFWAFLGYCLSMDELQVTRSHILTEEYFVVKIWSLELYQEISYEIFIFDHIWGEGAGIGKLATGDFCARSGPPQLGAVLVFTCNYLNYLLLFSWTLRICLYMISWNVGIPAQISLFFVAKIIQSSSSWATIKPLKFCRTSLNIFFHIILFEICQSFQSYQPHYFLRNEKQLI